ncbi:MAG TPA: redoxin domain-containing protein [Candidatus Paceibacterota bacterium]|nr:redoxin domain-containing protein [Candidatus Paceibacterota bacterium]
MSELLLVSLLAGALTVLAPCILPLLPVIIGGSVAGEANARRAVVIVTALAASVFAFTLILKVSTVFVSIPAIFWQLLSGILLILFGLVTLFPSLWDMIPGTQALYQSSNKLLGSGYRKHSLWGDIIMGAALGPVFSSCSPTYFVILAAVLPANFTAGVLYLAAYVIGLGLSLFIIAYLGQRAATWLGLASDANGWFKKLIGMLFVLIGLAVILGLDKKLEAALPAAAFGETQIEQMLLGGGNDNSAATSTPAGAFLSPMAKALAYQKAPELAGIDGYINTDGQPIDLAQYIGKDVVLIDFWDYSCINCERTTPYLNAWYEKYKGQGLVIIGVHTPEFSFEHELANVQAAVNAAGIKYPVVLDNEYKTWNAYQNEYWPNEYLIDIDGYVVHEHAGEGEYAETEAAIQAALAERAARLGGSAVATSTVTIAPTDFSAIQSPETYFGSNRNEYLGNGQQGVAGAQAFTLPQSAPAPNTLYLGGAWTVAPEYAEGGAGADILYQYSAHDIYMVAAPAGGAPAVVRVLLDGKPVGALAGSDVDPASGTATIDSDRLYKLAHDVSPGIHTIEIEVVSGTLDAYTFTFG